jgi:hypothetical protein
MMGLFQAFQVPLICHLVEMVKQKKLRFKTWQEIAYDLQEVSYRQMVQYRNVKRLFKDKYNISTFYPSVFREPERYILPRPELRKYLEVLVQSRKTLFLLTDFYPEWLDVVM